MRIQKHTPRDKDNNEKESDEKTTWILGRLGINRGIKKYFQIDTATDDMSVGSVDAGKAMSAVNFFVLSLRPHQGRHRGLFTRYKESGGIALMKAFWMAIGDDALRLKKSAAVASAGNGASDTALTAIDKKYSGNSVECEQLVNKKQYQAILAEWKRIQSLEIAFYSPTDENTHEPLDPFIGTELHKKTFIRADPDAILRRVGHYIRLPENRKANAVRVIGLNQEGIEDRMNILEDIPDWFGSEQLETIADDATLFVNDLKTCILIKRLIEVAANHPALFH